MTTKKMIFYSATQLFKQYGYKKTSLQMIAERCNVAKSLLTYYYPQKGDLLIELLESHLLRVYNHVSKNIEDDPLLVFFVFIRIYYKVMMFDDSTRRFHKEVLERNDRKLATYQNFNVLYLSIVKTLDLNISDESFLLREVSTFGANRELILNFYNNTVSITRDELLDLITENTCRCFGINNLLTNEYREKAAKINLEYEHLVLF